MSELPVRPSEDFVPLTQDELADVTPDETLAKAQTCPSREGPYFKWYFATLIIPLTNCDVQAINNAVNIGSSVAQVIGAICGPACGKVLKAVEFVLKAYMWWLTNANQACGFRGGDIHVTFIPIPVFFPFVWIPIPVPHIWRIC